MTGVFRFLRYCAAALASAAGDWLVFSALLSLAGLPDMAALMVARMAGGLVSFVVNRHWTFPDPARGRLSRQGRRFLLLYGLSYATAVGLFALLSGGIGLPPYPAKLATDISCFVGNFFAMRLYVFHRRTGLAGLVLRRGRRLTGADSR
ncbi:MAG: GtrA family protein [Telmatospirillum sp.]|nr:GtrA family protein [Telmatospirillum sp.]